VGSLFDLFSQTDALSPFITRSPSPTDVQHIFDTAVVLDPEGGGPTSIEAIFDFRLQNIARTKTNGIDVSASTTWDSPQGKFTAQLGGNYMKHLDFQAASTASTVDLANKIFNPMDLRLRGSLGWSRTIFSSTLSASYADSYENNLLTPTGRVSSWTTVDWQLALRSPEGSNASFLSNVSASLSVLNLFDRDPPQVLNPNPSGNFGYDATNASPLGRLFAVAFSKRW
jgi:iron complex outermembrane recepter protein